MKLYKGLFFVIFLGLLMGNLQFASACSPAVVGSQRYINGQLEVCNGTEWKSARGQESVILGNCKLENIGTAKAVQGVSGRTYFICADSYFSFNYNNNLSSPPLVCNTHDEGKQQFISGKMQFCDGRTWQ